jgi:tetratricopeptide (TPR) repeat protein
VSRSRNADAHPNAALLAAAIAMAAPMLSANASTAPNSSPAQTPSLSEANTALQAGEADKALALLATFPQSGPGAAQEQNILCRVRLTLEQWDAAVTACEQAVHLDPENSGDHLWLGRALGEKASRASFLTAYSLAKRTRAEFEDAVRLNPRNVQALSDLGDFYRQAPSVVGGGIDKAEGIVADLEKIDQARADELRGRIAEQKKDFLAAESEYKKMVTAGTHPALGWSALAAFYARRQRFDEMESAVRSLLSEALHEKQAGVALYDGAGLLTEAHRDPALAATMLDDYLAGSSKTEEAPAFVAHLRLARLKAQLGDTAAAERERTAALALAHEYKPAQDFKPQNRDAQQASN